LSARVVALASDPLLKSSLAEHPTIEFVARCIVPHEHHHRIQSFAPNTLARPQPPVNKTRVRRRSVEMPSILTKSFKQNILAEYAA
jgi:hypothetical protein